MSSEHKRPISPFSDVSFGSIVFPMIFIGIFYGLDTWLKSPKLLSYPLTLISIPFIVSGVSLAIWCFKVSLELPKKPILVTWGPWAHVRHPIYIAGIFVHVGVAIMFGTVVQLLGSIGYALIDPLFTPLREERQLREAFPVQYEEYSERVPGWIPRIRKKHVRAPTSVGEVAT